MELWDPQIPAWCADRRILRFDQRGQGASEAPPAPYRIDDLGRDALAVLDAYQVEQADVCGLSLGGVVALWLAINHPERVRRLILASTAAKVGTEDLWRARAEAALHEGTASIADMVMERSFSPSFRAADPQAVAAARAALVAAADEATPPSVMRELCSEIPGARWRELEGAGHLANLEVPEAFAAAVLDHLA